MPGHNPGIATRRPSSLAPWARAAAVLFGVGWGANQFSSLLLAYRLHRGISESTADALFGVYALGLIPALLLVGPISDVYGRRASVRAAGVVSVLATLALILGDHALAMLYLGRFLAGVGSGAAFAAGTAWVKELSVPPHDPEAGEQAGARRAAIALSAGFGLGPLVAGLLAQWAPAPLIVPYLPHLAVMVLALLALAGAPETVDRSAAGPLSLAARLRVSAAGHPRFRRVVAPSAPWVFAAPSIAFAVLPGLVATHTKGFEVGFAALVAGLTLLLGVLVQPLARRLDRVDAVGGTAVGLLSVIAGMAIGALAAQLGSWALVVLAAVLLGGGYGFVLVSGLLQVQRLAPAAELASLTAVFYAITYLGFAAPIVLAELEHLASAPVLLLAGAGLAALALAAIVRNSPRNSSAADHPA